MYIYIYMAVKRRKTKKNKRRQTRRLQFGGEINEHEVNKLISSIGRFFQGEAPSWGDVKNQKPLDLLGRYLQIISMLENNGEYQQLLSVTGFGDSVSQLLNFIQSLDTPDTTAIRFNPTLFDQMQILTYNTINRKVFDIGGKLLESLESGTISNIIDEVREFNEHYEPWGSKSIKIEPTDPRYGLALRKMGAWEGAVQGREDLQQSQEASQGLREGEEALAKEEIPAEVFGSIKDKMIDSIPQQYATEQAQINNTTDFYSILVPYEAVALHLFYLSHVQERGLMGAEQARFDSALKTRDISVLQMNLNEISSELIAFLKNFQFENEESGSLNYGNTSAIVNVLESADPKSKGYDLLKKISENRRLTNLSSLLNGYVKQLENNLWVGWNEKIPESQLSRIPLPPAGTFGDLLLQGAKALQQLKIAHPSLPRFSGGYAIPEGSTERQILNIVVKDIMNVLIKNMLFVIHDFYSIDDLLKSRGIDLDDEEFEALKLDTVGHMVFYAAVSTNYQGVSLHYEETPQELIKFVEVERTEVTSRQVSDEIKRGDLLKKREETGVAGPGPPFGLATGL